MTAIEIRLDTILPTLATKADLEILRSDVQQLAAVTTTQFAELRPEFGELRAEFDEPLLRTDSRLNEMRAEMQKMNAEIKTWMLATMITIGGTMLAAVFSINQIHKGATPMSPSVAPAPVIATVPGTPAPAAPGNARQDPLPISAPVAA